MTSPIAVLTLHGATNNAEFEAFLKKEWQMFSEKLRSGELPQIPGLMLVTTAMNLYMVYKQQEKMHVALGHEGDPCPIVLHDCRKCRKHVYEQSRTSLVRYETILRISARYAGLTNVCTNAGSASELAYCAIPRHVNHSEVATASVSLVHLLIRCNSGATAL